ncbi:MULTISPECIES: hypothetical protein [Mesorhizobium]|uniref:hypothetical protein n=1 Tax=Mesorhizobium sp. TaxID=1871066 RepID=UPI001F11C6C6|nr:MULTISPECIES: hypothetical protein [Mesorhizobium]
MRELLHGEFAVGNVSEKNQPMCMSQRAGEIRYFVKDRMMDTCVFHIAWPTMNPSINQSIH